MFQESCKRVSGVSVLSSRVFGNFKEVLRVLSESFNSVSRNFKGVSWHFQGCYKEVSGKFQWCFKKVPRVFE